MHTPTLHAQEMAERLRLDFPVLWQTIHGSHPLIYLDNAATSLKPRVVPEAVAYHDLHDTSNIHRGIHFLSEQATSQYEHVRERVQHFIHARHAHEIIFTRGTTEAINLIATSVGRSLLQKGDVILTTEMEHHANIVPWQLACEQSGATLDVIPMNDRGELDMDVAAKKIRNGVKLLTVTHISNSLGTINPIEELIALAHQHGAWVLIDAAQSVPHLPIDVQALDCDFLVFSAHKMLGPTGVGVLFGREDVLSTLPPYQGGGGMIDLVTFEKTTYKDLPDRFEAGTPNISGVIGFGAAIHYMNQLDRVELARYEHELLLYGTECLRQVPGLRIIGEAQHKSSILSFVIDGIHAQDIGTYCDQYGIAVRTGHHCAQPTMRHFNIPATARASLSFINRPSDLDKLCSTLMQARRFFL